MNRRWKTERPKLLAEEDVQVIRKLLKLGYLQSDIAAFFGVTQQMISAIYNRSKRVDVPDNPLVDISKFIQRERGMSAEQILSLVGLEEAPQEEPRKVFARRF